MTDGLAIIPARGGSKRVPRKNVRDVGGKPLIAHTIRAASESTVDDFVVSTDDDEIATVAEEYGASVLRRPEELADDETPTAPVVTHAIESLGGSFKQVCLLQPTVPLRMAEDIDGTMESFRREPDADSLVSVTVPPDPPHWAVSEADDGFLEETFEPNVLWGDTRRSQDLPKTWIPNGAIYVASVDAWREYESFYTPRTLGYEMPPERSIDVDEPWELEVVRALIESGDAGAGSK